MSATMTSCQKCHGTGYVSLRISRGCAGDICFRCNGLGIVRVSKPRKARPEKVIEYTTCYAACWIVNGQREGFGNFYHATLEGAAAEAAIIRPMMGYYEAQEVRIPKSSAHLIKAV